MQTEVIPYVQSVDQEERDAKYWDSVAMMAENARCRSMLVYSEALYNLDREKGYIELGFDSIYEYVYDRFGRSRASTTQTIAVYKKYVIELGRTIDELVGIGIGKLSQMVAHVSQDTIEQDLDDMETLSQKEISDRLKEKEGMAPNETLEKDGDHRLVFKGPATMIDVVKVALDLAGENIANGSDFYQERKDVPPLKSLEFICAVFLSSSDLDGNPYSTLDRSIESLQNIYGIKIKWEKEDA